MKVFEVTNFKSLRDARFDPRKFACLIGENNAGKSTVLQAIVHALNRPTQLPIGVYYDATAPIVFKLNFAESQHHIFCDWTTKSTERASRS